MFKGNYSCNRAVIFELVFFCCYRYFEPTTNHQPLSLQMPTTNHQPPSPQNVSHATITTTTNHFLHKRQNANHLHHKTSATPPLRQSPNHLLHHANYQSPSPQPRYNPLRVENRLCHGEERRAPITPGISLPLVLLSRAAGWGRCSSSQGSKVM